MPDDALVLHVDDPAVTDLAARRVEREQPSLSVVTAATATEGLEVLDDRDVDCVVSDYRLPDRDGLDFLRAVRERDPGLPFVLFTGRGSETVASEAIAAGVTDYIRKRADAEEYSLLANRVCNAVEQYRSARRAERRARQQDVVADLGQRALGETDLPGLFDAAAAGVAEGLAVDHVALFERVADGSDEERFELRTAVDWPVVDGGPLADRPLLRDTLEQGSVVEQGPEAVVTGDVDVRSCISVAVGDGSATWGVLLACDDSPRSFSADDLSFVRSVANVVASESARTERERRLTRLHAATRDLLDAGDAEDVAGTVLDAARDVLGFDVSGVRLRSGATLDPVAMSEERLAVLGDPPRYDVEGDSPVARAFRTGETVVLEEAPPADDDQDRDLLGSAAFLPLGEHGTLSVATTRSGELTEDDLTLLEILTANATVALDRVDQQERVSEHERQLQQEHDKLTALFDNAADPTVEYVYEDGEAIVERVNDAFTETFGYEADGAVGRPLKSLVVPEERRASADTLDERARRGEQVDVEVRRRTGTGELRDFRFRNIPVTDDPDQRGYAVYTDITGRKAREQRLQVLNRVLRHNLRNDMNVVLGIADLVREDLESPALREEMDALQRVGERLLDRSNYARTVEETLADSDEDKPLDVAAMAAEEVADAAERYPGVEFTTDLPESAVATAGNRLRAAIRELLSNAVEHDDTGDPTVSLSVETVTRESRRHVVVSVADEGPGIPEHERTVLVEGSETPLQHGSGLGLWLVRWVVQAAGGWLTIEDREPRGSRVTMYLPAAEQPE